MHRTLSFLTVVTLCSAPALAQQTAIHSTSAPDATTVVAQARPAQAPTPPTTPRPAQPQRPATPAPPAPPGSGIGGPPPVPVAPPAPAPPRPEPLPTENVRLDLAISDSTVGAAKKSVSMLVAGGRNGRIRSTTPPGYLNVDSRPEVLRDGRVLLNLTVQYNPSGGEGQTNVDESLSMIVPDGKPTVVSQSADPRTDRKVTVEVTATVVK